MTTSKIEFTAISATAAIIVVHLVNSDAVCRAISAVRQPENNAASTYLQTVAMIGAMLNSIGLPAYQKEGITRIQKDALQATAMPTAPQGRPNRKSRKVTPISKTPHPSHRSALPMERCIQPCM